MIFSRKQRSQGFNKSKGFDVLKRSKTVHDGYDDTEKDLTEQMIKDDVKEQKVFRKTM